MKKNFGIILAIMVGLSALLLTIVLQAGWVKAMPFFQSERATDPEMIVSYQGQIWEGDVPYNGDGYFKFVILNGKGEWVWSNDGDLDPKPITLPVENGLFTVLLGDSTIANMTNPLTADVFGDPGAVLQVWFSPDNDIFTQMPDQKIASVPYALQANYAQNSDTLDGKHAAAFQLRVTGTCPTGQAVKQVNADGSVSCESIPQLPTFSINTLDSTGVVGFYTAIAVGTDGLGLISYCDETNDNLKVAHCSDAACSSASTYALDSTGNVGTYTSVAVGTDGLGLISYHDDTNGNLKVAHCSDTACSSASTYTLDSTGGVGYYTSITIGIDGLGLISYYDVANSNLKVAHCSNTACSSASTYALDSTGNVGQWTSIAIGIDGLGLISYRDVTNGNLKVAHCSNTACSSASTYALDSTGNVGSYTAIAIGTDGFGLISYYDGVTNYNLKVAHCSNTACSSAYTYTLDSPGYVGPYTSIAIGPDGLGLISYYDDTNQDLRVAHCSNHFCIPDY